MLRKPANPTLPQRTAGAMRPSAAVVWLSGLIAVLALVAAGSGLFWQDGGGRVAFTSVRGEAVEIHGRGVYRYDTRFIGAGNRGTDAVTLGLGLPLLVLSALRYRRGSVRGGLLLLGTLVYFLYVYASYALGTAYNSLFLVYIALSSAGLFAFVLAFTSLDRRALAAHCSPRLPRRGVALFMVASGLVTLVVWLAPLLGALVRHEPPARLGHYTTTITEVLDLGVITPAALASGALILRRAALGYLIACALLVLEVLLAPLLAAQTVSQLAAGVSFTTAEIVGPLAGFAVLAAVAVGTLVALLRNISGHAPVPAAPA